MSAICDAHKTATRRRWKLNYYITHCSGSSISWRENPGLKNMSQRGWAPRSPVEQPKRTGKKRGYGHESGGQYVAVLFGLQLPLTHNTFNKVVPYSQLTLCAKWTYNVHYYRIYKEHRNLGIRKHVKTSCSGTKPFY